MQNLRSLKNIKMVVMVGILSYYQSVVHSQNVGVGTATPNASAMLDVSSTTKGLLLPRMTTVQRDAIVAPNIGLIIYNLQDSCFNIFNGTTWTSDCQVKNNGYETVPILEWQQKANLSGVIRIAPVSFSIGGKGYLGTGYNAGNYLKDFWEYNPISNSWSQKADLGGVGRSYASGFSIGNKGYIGIGSTGLFATTNDFWEYDATANTWTQKANFSGIARTEAVAFSLNNKGYIGTGFGGGPTKQFWEYNPVSNAWTQKTDFLGEARSGASSFVINNKGYIGLGVNNGTKFKNVFEYNPTNNVWTEKALFPGNGRFGGIGFNVGQKGYFGLGCDAVIGGTYYTNLYEYNPINNTWVFIPNFTGGFRKNATSFSIDNCGYVACGADQNDINKNDLWCYKPYVQGYNYSESYPNNALSYSDHAWTKESDKLYTKDQNIETNVRGKLLVSPNSALIDPDYLFNQIGIGRIADGTGWDVDLGIGGYNGNTWGIGSSVAGNLYIGLGNGLTTNSMQTAIEFNKNRNLFLVPISGNVGIGTTNPTHKLSVKGSVRCQEVVVELANWPDYVFDKKYKLSPLSYVENYINKYHHLPNIPSAFEIEQNGSHLGDMQKKMMEKIEELTLYMIELSKENQSLKKDIELLKTSKKD